MPSIVDLLQITKQAKVKLQMDNDMLMLVEIRIQIIIYSSILNKETIYKISQKHLPIASLKANEIEHKMLKPLTF